MADAPATPEQAKRQSMMIAIGDSGLKAYGGYLQEEFLRELQGPKGRRVYREMAENDATIGAILEAITALICGAEWTVVAANDEQKGEDAKKFLEEEIKELETPLPDVLTEACTMFTYGFAPMEWTARSRGDGKIGLKEIALRSQSSLVRWEMDAEGKLLGMWQQATWKHQVFIPIDKLALFRTRSIKNNPEGRSILRNVYRSWYFKCRMEEIEGIGVERDLAGLPVLKIPSRYFDPGASADEKAFFEHCKQLVTQIRRESREGIIIPSDKWEAGGAGGGGLTGIPQVELTLLNSGGARTFDTTAIIDRWDRRIATAVLADFIFLGQQSVGSFALSSDKTALFAQVVGAYLKRIADVLNRQVVKPIWELNGFDLKDMPTLTPGDIETPDLNELSGFISTLVGAGAQMFPDRELENYLRKASGLPELPEEEGLEDQGAPGGDWELAAPEPKPDAKDPAGRAASALKRLKQALEAA